MVVCVHAVVCVCVLWCVWGGGGGGDRQTEVYFSSENALSTPIINDSLVYEMALVCVFQDQTQKMSPKVQPPDHPYCRIRQACFTLAWLKCIPPPFPHLTPPSPTVHNHQSHLPQQPPPPPHTHTHLLQHIRIIPPCRMPLAFFGGWGWVVLKVVSLIFFMLRDHLFDKTLHCTARLEIQICLVKKGIGKG